MSNLIEIQSQIEKLQKQASELRSKDFQKTVKEIREKMQAFGISIKDLQTVKSTGRSAKAGGANNAPKKRSASSARKAGGSTVAAKYRGPEGQTWSGRGLTPRWLASLVEQGRTKEEFLIST
ncbi:MAG: histone-like nucleoid-structuring protein [Polaromonas sp.]|nr:histone-like nucleoid-structuring protein [Polaromonas sp.]